MTPDAAQEQVTELERLALTWFRDLGPAESLVLRSAQSGKLAICGPNQTDEDPENDASKGDKWGNKRQVRADLIRRLFVDRRAKELVDPRGIRIYGAVLVDTLDLSKLTASFGLTLWHCRLMADASLRDITVPYLDFQGSWVASIGADRAAVASYVLLRNFHADGPVRLLSARIGGNLECDGATLENGNGPALFADGLNVTGAVFLRDGFNAKGEVRLVSAQIGGEFDCRKATFKNGSGVALNAGGVNVRGSVYLRNAFSAEGSVVLVGAQIGGDLDCNGAKFTGALNTRGAVIKGDLFLKNLVNPDGATVDVSNTSVQALRDDGKWPGKMDLDGFVYQRISEGPTDAKSRFPWLALQQPFKPQPYRQLAKVLSDVGYDSEAQDVLIGMERRHRALSWTTQPASLLLRLTIGYGYDPLRAVWELASFSILGWIIFRRAHLAGAMTPTDKDAYDYYKKNGAPPPYYQGFSPLIYSVENSLPLVKLGQADLWQPDPSPQARVAASGKRPHLFTRVISSPRFLRGFLWSLIMLGWIFATLFAAGMAGLVHSK